MAIKWSPSSLKLALDCELAYYYKYARHINVPKSGRQTAGSFLHTRIQNFFEEFGEYKSDESYAAAMRGRWYYNTEGNKFRDKSIEWQDDTERHSLGREIENASRLIYARYTKEGRPLFNPELKLEANIDGRSYFGVVDEIRTGHVVRDHKFTRRDMNAHKNIVKLNTDLQFTMYSVIYSVAATQDAMFNKICPAYINKVFDTDELTIRQLKLFEPRVNANILNTAAKSQIRRTIQKGLPFK